MSEPIRVGLVGTGYAARLRAEALIGDERSRLVAVSGNTPERTSDFCQIYGVEMADSWQSLVQRPDLDLIVIANVNRDHGAITRAALYAHKHVVVEYPLSLDLAEAEEIIQLAETQGCFLHVEHVDQLSGIHQAVVDALPEVGTPFYVRYASLNGQHPAPTKWTYCHDLFGFPLVGAVSRIHRLTSLFGTVEAVNGQARFWYRTPDYPKQEYAFDATEVAGMPYHTGICTAQLRFTSGLIADVSYGKGEAIWQSERSLDIHGDRALLQVGTTEGRIVTVDAETPLTVGGRRGLFAKDTAMVLDHLTEKRLMYVTVESTTYALRVADAIRRACVTGKTVNI